MNPSVPSPPSIASSATSATPTSRAPRCSRSFGANSRQRANASPNRQLQTTNLQRQTSLSTSILPSATCALAHPARHQRHRHPRPHELRPLAPRRRRDRRAHRNRRRTTTTSNTTSPPAPAAAVPRTSSTTWPCCAGPRPRPSSTTTPPPWCWSSGTSARRRATRSSSPAASWCRSAADSAFPRSSNPAARACARSARRTGRRSTTTPRNRPADGDGPESASQQFLHGRLRRIAADRRASRRWPARQTSRSSKTSAAAR